MLYHSRVHFFLCISLQLEPFSILHLLPSLSLSVTLGISKKHSLPLVQWVKATIKAMGEHCWQQYSYLDDKNNNNVENNIKVQMSNFECLFLWGEVYFCVTLKHWWCGFGWTDYHSKISVSQAPSEPVDSQQKCVASWPDTHRLMYIFRAGPVMQQFLWGGFIFLSIMSRISCGE